MITHSQLPLVTTNIVQLCRLLPRINDTPWTVKVSLMPKIADPDINLVQHVKKHFDSTSLIISSIPTTVYD